MMLMPLATRTKSALAGRSAPTQPGWIGTTAMATR